MQEENILIQAGLSEEQSQTYQALLDKGPQRASDLSKWTGIKRGLIYKVLEQLESIGLVSKKGGPGTVAVFSPSHPSLLLTNIERKEKEIALNKEMLASSIGSLSSKYNLIIGKPNVQFFEGEDGVAKVANDSIYSKSEILSYIDNEAVNKYMSDLNKKYVSERKNLNLKKKMLAVDSAYIREHVKDMDKNTTEVRVLPKSEAFGTVMQIYDDKISYVTVSDNKKIGVIIEDPDIAKMHKIIFQTAWEKAEVLEVGV
jgi:sugar-specific transcriptional regulator TrmB